MALRPALAAAHSRTFHQFTDVNRCIHSRFPHFSENFRVRKVEFAGRLRESAIAGLNFGRVSNFGVVCRASKRDLSLERSDKANEELLMFFFQLDLTTRLQRALNQDMYEAAQGLREKIAEVEREMARQRREKTGSGSASKTDAHDTAITLLQTKAKLQRLIEEEDYEAAGVVRKKIMALEAESLAAQANAMIYQQRSFEFRLGQKLKHRVHGYRGVVCGMDPVCCESDEWTDAVGVEKLPRGRNQPFYQVALPLLSFYHSLHANILSRFAERILKQWIFHIDVLA